MQSVIDDPVKTRPSAQRGSSSKADRSSPSRNARRWGGEPSLQEVLADPIVQQVMKRDGIKASDIHALAQHVRARMEKLAHMPRPVGSIEFD